MTLDNIRAVIATGDKYGSGFRQLLHDLRICNLSNVTDDQVQWWLTQRKECDEYDDSNNRENQNLCD